MMCMNGEAETERWRWTDRGLPGAGRAAPQGSRRRRHSRPPPEGREKRHRQPAHEKSRHVGADGEEARMPDEICPCSPPGYSGPRQGSHGPGSDSGGRAVARQVQGQSVEEGQEKRDQKRITPLRKSRIPRSSPVSYPSKASGKGRWRQVYGSGSNSGRGRAMGRMAPAIRRPMDEMV